MLILDNGSKKNLVASAMVKAFGLPITPHLHPYRLVWVTDDALTPCWCPTPALSHSLWALFSAIRWSAM
jgi:hypothetical protein